MFALRSDSSGLSDGLPIRRYPLGRLAHRTPPRSPFPTHPRFWLRPKMDALRLYRALTRRGMSDANATHLIRRHFDIARSL